MTAKKFPHNPELLWCKQTPRLGGQQECKWLIWHLSLATGLLTRTSCCLSGTRCLSSKSTKLWGTRVVGIRWQLLHLSGSVCSSSVRFLRSLEVRLKTCDMWFITNFEYQGSHTFWMAPKFIFLYQNTFSFSQKLNPKIQFISSLKNVSHLFNNQHSNNHSHM